ncbi:hypothetical protein [Sutcliffiella halmapala]|uniref:hypothetical protein n=1 Tax=Sutcliffiella halmapala TaxID=79882 RepID=UPI000994A327|nr:hypothetical protein [Sutcliffiella halmapala]
MNEIPRDILIENVCGNCPGSLWGTKSICRIHNRSIGEINTCKEWNRRSTSEAEASFINQEGQLAFTVLEPAIEVVQKTEEDLRSYHWMMREIDRLQKELDKALKGFIPQSSLVAQYGVEATLPKAQGTKPSTMSVSEEKYDRQYKRLKALQEKIKKIDIAAAKLTDQKESTVLECILDGERMNMIASHVGVSRQRLNEIKRLLVKKIAWELYGDDIN